MLAVVGFVQAHFCKSAMYLRVRRIWLLRFYSNASALAGIRACLNFCEVAEIRYFLVRFLVVSGVCETYLPVTVDTIRKGNKISSSSILGAGVI